MVVVLVVMLMMMQPGQICLKWPQWGPEIKW
jgi:hypothetical protein